MEAQKNIIVFDKLLICVSIQTTKKYITFVKINFDYKMKIDKDLLHKIAHLSRLDFNEQDEAKMLISMNSILDWVEQLNEVDTTNVKPLTHMSEETNSLREDLAKEPLSHERGLRNAPRKDSDYFRVPKVIE